MFGIRTTDYGANVDVVNGVVTRVDIHLSYRTSTGWHLSAGTTILDKFSDPSLCSNPAFRQHPEYVVESGKAFPFEVKVPDGDYIIVGITPRATPQEWQSAQTIDLTCVTRMSKCSVAELMPLAYRDWNRDMELQKNAPAVSDAGTCPVTLEPGLKPIHWWATRGRLK